MTGTDWIRAEIADLSDRPFTGLVARATLNARIPDRPSFGVFRM
jgi:hypothetical protein